MNAEVSRFWSRFRAAHPDAGSEPFDVFRVGDTDESADGGADLIVSGTKTATSSLPEELVDIGIPFPGALSVVIDGKARPRAVVETMQVSQTPFGEVDAKFAHDYGEWDRTLETWKARNGAHYRAVCEGLGLEWHEQRELICERFKVVFSDTAHHAPSRSMSHG
ncbi:MAG: ASCH domain-containing protein [Roseitalea sp.]|uniref:ASCH domain-containing protein n=1 Tax=Oceaniradius stylonematis TaxID=2184161 RepID=UPI000F3E6D3E|nr:ASCH domain-containing protein [Oceaniradius stylonematis]MBO6552793.1 ASCH domain-containing protein [Roseitalea sp.]MBO6950286.1 ASCH domain-containing protein [Rhizobiaceae bacterium]RNC94733.1 MAG: ASCH domain-containing protein [Oricola sp.]MBO6591725.1 ASCH domain-containing protein [Roseitalea sp.]MBO6599580.1 ASCH domain-containing protein [Roseitalea sp.]